ncbi:TraB/GumN family protein [Novosphingobium rosa]|uniref:TraB/GumN family protein n=1 Tax=Novosphingobium rosa TaxID=76978 RepID=UPI000832FD57|nr:TraB/GumN family protein [Novosphingobium rosa]
MFNKPFWRSAAALTLALLAGACSRTDPANPALWHVEGPQGQQAWLFGTIHALPRPVAWRTARVDAALGQASLLMVEIADLNNDGATRAIYNRLAHAPDQPPIASRVPDKLRPALGQLMGKAGLRPDSFGDTETWAVALALGHAAQGDAEDAANGVDRALLSANHLPVSELEGAQKQLGLFDSLPESAQRAMLASVIEGAPKAPEDTKALEEAWRRGDMGWIGAQTSSGMLADPVLRHQLYLGRNHAWEAAITAAMAHGQKPFVAVGAAHMAGPDGLPALLAAHGYRVTRVE